MLDDKRKELNKIDDEIARLYAVRMECVKEIAKLKADNDIKLTDYSREKEIINRVTASVNDDIAVYIKQLYNTIFETSKAYQSQFINIKSDIKESLIDIINRGVLSFPTRSTVACQGIIGSYSNIAAERLFQLSNIMFFKNFEAVFNAVDKGLCEYGVLPIENSSVGSVNAVYDLMKKYDFYIVRSIKLRVQHNLLARRGTNKNGIKEIVSHEQAINQCADFIKSLGNDVTVTVCPNTAVAAKMVAESGRTDIACLSSRECADIYGLDVLESNVQDVDNNFTRFICISKKLKLFENSNRISLMINLRHEPGSLNKLLNKFSALGLNLTKLESRPNGVFEFMFYFDFEGNIMDKNVLNLIAELEITDNNFKFLGSYQEVN